MEVKVEPTQKLLSDDGNNHFGNYGAVKGVHSGHNGVGNGRKPRSDTQSNNVVLSCHDINYLVKTKVKKQKVFKPILKNITAVFEPGMNAILGPTGSGKTSLLDILAMRKDPNGMSGQVLIDGAVPPPDFRLISGYVVQEDIVMGTLTVRENLTFSASVRFRKTVSKADKKRRVQEVIEELSLQDCAETKIGNVYIRGVSGGERKRTNVGMELITRPNILFLDEPTTGLDASTANSVIMILSKLAQRGRTIILSIHQPRYSIYRMFDKLHLLSKGETVYHGKANKALDYFKSLGYHCEEHNNPPDFFLDVINGDSFAISSIDDELGAVEEGKPKTEPVPPKDLGDVFLKTQAYMTMKSKADEIYETFLNVEAAGGAKVSYPTSFLRQLFYVSGRATKNILRNPKSSYMQVIVLAFIAVIVGLIYFQIDKSASSGIQNRVGAFFFVVTNMIFGNVSANEVFIAERTIFLHESAGGFYRVSVYFFSKVFCDLLPMRIVPTFLFAAITYWMIGFRPDAAASFIYALTLIATAVSASSLAFLLGACFNILAIANLMIAMAYVFMMIFGGLLINIASLPSWVQYLQYLSIIRYAMNALSINELRDQEFCDPPVANTTQNCIEGNDYLETQGISFTDWAMWENIVAMGALTVVCLFLTYVRLRNIPRFK
ncbi:broad substrate specificity ATP-binding cassette transporter ABCG2-like isoform X1 [Asterias amurensis]|uniref:broad substrate specificity ATP-binding cassette transporter ABCG2-like isoform X1 n=1 Tax=Asterias amurensis TaxID=7602 RepID=UPI003AB670DB